MKKAELVKLTNELNKVLQLEPPIDTKMAADALELECVTQALGLLEKEDEISDELSDAGIAWCEKYYDEVMKTDKKYIEQLVEMDFLVPKEKKAPARQKAAAEKAEKADKAPAKKKSDAPKKEKGDTLAAFIDETVQAGGDWVTILALCNDEAKRREANTNFTKATINAHVKYRLAKDSKYLGKLKITADGIE